MKFLSILLMALLLPLAALAAPAGPLHDASGMTEPQKIEALIVSVEQLPGAVFIRNGGEYDGAKAGSHLRLKWKNSGKRVKTAEDFILFCASASSMSGKKYQIRFADGKTVDSEQYFHDQLHRLENGKAIVKPAVKPGVKPVATATHG
jgi:hypothetical protein